MQLVACVSHKIYENNLCEEDWRQLVLNSLDTTHYTTLNTEWKCLSPNYISLVCFHFTEWTWSACAWSWKDLPLLADWWIESLLHQCEFLKVLFTELCIAATFLTFSNTQLQIASQLDRLTRTNSQVRHAQNSLENTSRISHKHVLFIVAIWDFIVVL